MLWTENIYDVQESALAELTMFREYRCYDVADLHIGVGDYVMVTGYSDSSFCWIDAVAGDESEMERHLRDFLMAEWNFCVADTYRREIRHCEVWHVVPDVVAHVCEVTDVDIVDVCEDSAALAHTLLHIDWRDTMDGATGKAAIIIWNDGQNSLSISPDWQGVQPDFLEDAVEDATMLNLYGWPMIGSLGDGKFNLYEDAEYIMNAARAWADSVMVSNDALRQLRAAGRVC